MFVINPDPFLLPTFRISPFTTEYIAINSELPDDDFAVHYFNEKFGTGKWQYTYNGREAIKLALEVYDLAPNDLVTILTTSNNFYISSCVTKEIETKCRWNREIVAETKIIFVNHEFGYPYPDMEKLVATRLPIIEDCCTTFFSQDSTGRIGEYGDFSVYSFPKFFPIQIGGLVINNSSSATNKSVLNPEEIQYIQNVLSFQLINETTLLQKRKAIFDYASAQFSKLGFTLRFKSKEKVIPSVLLVNNNAIIKDLVAFKQFLVTNGVQSSIFYGEDAFFLPNNQILTCKSVNYITALITYFINFNPI